MKIITTTTTTIRQLYERKNAAKLGGCEQSGVIKNYSIQQKVNTFLFKGGTVGKTNQNYQRTVNCDIFI